MPAFPLASAWWHKHGLAERVERFCASSHPTPSPSCGSVASCGRLSSSCPSLSHCSPTSTPSHHHPYKTNPAPGSTVPLLLVSACLLYHPVTYRGAQARLPPTLRPTPLLFLTEVLAKELGLVRCLPVCPEMQWLNLPAPRPPLRLERDGSREGSDPSIRGRSSLSTAEKAAWRRLVSTAPHSPSLFSFNANSSELPPSLLAQLPVSLDAIDGVVLRSRSPSCGVQDARLYAEDAALTRSATACSADARPTRACATAAAASSSSYELVDGFFTQLLRNSLRTRCGAGGSEDNNAIPSALSPPSTIITSDRLLKKFYAVDGGGIGVGVPSTVSNVERSDSLASAKEAASPGHTSLEGFMDAVLRRHQWHSR